MDMVYIKIIIQSTNFLLCKISKVKEIVIFYILSNIFHIEKKTNRTMGLGKIGYAKFVPYSYKYQCSVKYQH